MSNSSIENKLVKFLQKKGYYVEVEPVYPSTIDILATKGDKLILAEIKSVDRIDASDIVKLKSYENLLKRVKKPKKKLVRSFLISSGTITESAQRLSKELKINILRPNELRRFYSHRVFKK